MIFLTGQLGQARVLRCLLCVAGGCLVVVPTSSHVPCGADVLQEHEQLIAGPRHSHGMEVRTCVGHARAQPRPRGRIDHSQAVVLGPRLGRATRRRLSGLHGAQCHILQYLQRSTLHRNCPPRV